MRLFFAAILFACGAAPASTASLMYSNASYELVDVMPGDGVAPSFALDPGSATFADLISSFTAEIPSDYESRASLYIGIGNVSVLGTLSPGTEIHWVADVVQTVTSIDVGGVQNPLDTDSAEASFGWWYSPYGSGFEMPDYLGYGGGTYQRRSHTSTLHIDAYITPSLEGLFWAGRDFYARVDAFRAPPAAVPEPSSVLLTLGGLAVVVGVARRDRVGEERPGR